MTPKELTHLIESTEGVRTVEALPINPMEDNVLLLLITFNPLSQNGLLPETRKNQNID